MRWWWLTQPLLGAQRLLGFLNGRRSNPKPICSGSPSCILRGCLLWQWGPRIAVPRAGRGRFLPRQQSPRAAASLVVVVASKDVTGIWSSSSEEVGKAAAWAAVAACWIGNAATWACTWSGWPSQSLAEGHWMFPLQPLLSDELFFLSTFLFLHKLFPVFAFLPPERRRKGPLRTGTWRRRR